MTTPNPSTPKEKKKTPSINKEEILRRNKIITSKITSYDPNHVYKNLTIDTPKTAPTDSNQPVELCWFESHSCTVSGQDTLLSVFLHSASLLPSYWEGCNLTHCDFNNRFCTD